MFKQFLINHQILSERVAWSNDYLEIITDVSDVTFEKLIHKYPLGIRGMINKTGDFYIWKDEVNSYGRSEHRWAIADLENGHIENRNNIIFNFYYALNLGAVSYNPSKLIQKFNHVVQYSISSTAKQGSPTWRLSFPNGTASYSPSLARTITSTIASCNWIIFVDGLYNCIDEEFYKCHFEYEQARDEKFKKLIKQYPNIKKRLIDTN